MIKNAIQTLVFLILGTVAFFASFQFTLYTLDDYLNPLNAVDMVIREKVLKPGDRLNYIAILDRRKSCPSDIQRFVVSRKRHDHDDIPELAAKLDGLDFVHIWYRDNLLGTLELGRYHLIGHIVLPKDIPDGEYEFVVYSISHCAMITRVDKYPVNKFTVKSDNTGDKIS